MSIQQDNLSLAIAFKLAVKKPAERLKLAESHPELSEAIDFYEKNEKSLYENGLNKERLVILKALKENICTQIQEDGPASFCKASLK